VLNQPQEGGSPLLVPALVFLLVIGIVEGVVYAYKGNIDSERRLQALSYGADLRSRAERELSSVLYLTRGLTGYFSVRRDSLEEDEILEILRVAYQTTPLVRNFGVAVDYRLTYVYPRENNEAAIGMDYRELEEQWPEVRRAVDEQAPVLSERVPLVQGGEAFIYRDPIYIDDQYWGLLSTVIDAEPLLEAMFEQEEENARPDFAVRTRNDARQVSLWGDPELFDQDDVVVMTSERGWEFAIQAKDRDLHWLPIFILRIFGWILALIAAMGVYTVWLRRRDWGQPPG